MLCLCRCSVLACLMIHAAYVSQGKTMEIELHLALFTPNSCIIHEGLMFYARRPLCIVMGRRRGLDDGGELAESMPDHKQG